MPRVARRIIGLTLVIFSWASIAAPKPQAIEATNYTINPRPDWVVPQAIPGPSTTPAPSFPARFILRDAQISARGASLQRYFHEVREPLNPSGLQYASQIQIEFNPAFEKLQLHSVAVIRGTQRINKLAPGVVNLLRRETNLEQYSYDGLATASIILDDVRVHDRIDLEYTIVGSNPVFGNHFSSFVMLTTTLPIELSSARIVVPKQQALYFKVYSHSTPALLKNSGEYQELSWQMRNVPAVQIEDRAPAREFQLAWLQVSDFNTWKEASTWASGLFDGKDLQLLPPELTKQLEKWKRETQSPEELALKALSYAQNEIRYFAISLGENSHRPHRPVQVVQQRYGDCKDKTTLLLAMLKTLGIKAAPALVSTNLLDGVDEVIPDPRVFDHVIAQVEIGDKKYWLDATQQYQSGTLAQRSVSWFRKILVVEPETQSLSATPVDAHVPQGTEVIEQFKVKAFNMPVQYDFELRIHGSEAQSYRAYLGAKGLQALQQALFDDSKKRYPTLLSKQATTVEDKADSNEIIIRQFFEIPDFFDYVEGYLVGKTYASLDFGPAFKLPTSIKRRYPLAFPNPFAVNQLTTIELPDEVQRKPDPPLDFQNSFLEFHRTNRIEGKRIINRYTLKTTTGTLPATAIPQLIEVGNKADKWLYYPVIYPVAPEAMFRRAGARNAALASKNVAAQIDSYYADEVVGYTRALVSGKLSDKQLASVYEKRAVRYSFMGDSASALADLDKALSKDPNFTDAYITRAEVNLYANQLDLARGDFEQAMSLDPSRAAMRAATGLGLIEYWKRDYAKAAQQFQRAVEASTSTDAAYRALWLSLANSQQGKSRDPNVDQALQSVGADSWPGPILRFLQGTISEQDLLRAAKKPDNENALERICEAHFYMGEYHAAKGDTQKARAEFEEVLKTNVKDFVEYKFARSELKRLAN